jgi:hypothetical protein
MATGILDGSCCTGLSLEGRTKRLTLSVGTEKHRNAASGGNRPTVVLARENGTEAMSIWIIVASDKAQIEANTIYSDFGPTTG